MDEAEVRRRAESHGEAVVVRNLRQAAGDIAEEAGGKARQVMGELPDPTTAAQVDEVHVEGNECVVRIRYSGEPEDVVVVSRWAERDGRPKIVDLSLG